MSGLVVTRFEPTAYERAALYRAQREAESQQAKEKRMKKRKTAQGDYVARFPKVSDRGERIAEVRKQIADAFDEAEHAAALNDRMSSVETIDSGRFSVLGGQS